MKNTRYFPDYQTAYNYYGGNVVPSTEIALVGDGSYVFVSSDNAFSGNQNYFDATMTNDEIVEVQIEQASYVAYNQGVAYGEETTYPIAYEAGYNGGYSYGYEIGNDEGYSEGYDEGYSEGYDEGEASAPQPEGNIEITTTSQVDVASYATAQVVDNNLVAANIKSGTTILGVSGSYTGLVPSGTTYLTNTSATDVTTYATAQIQDANLVAANIKSGTTILGVSGSYTGLVPSGTTYLTNTSATDVTTYATAQIQDANLVAANIVSGVSILGVTGSYVGGEDPVVDATVEIIANQTSQLMFHDAWYGYIKWNWEQNTAEAVIQMPNTYYSYVPYWAVNTLSDFGNDFQEFYVDKITPNGVVDITSYCYVTGSGANTYINYPNAQTGDKIGAGLYNIYSYIGDAQPIWLYDETTGSHWLEAQSDGTFSIGFGLDENSEAPENYGDNGEPGYPEGAYQCPDCGGSGEDGEGGECSTCEGLGYVYKCPDCGGSGEDGEGGECSTCGGTGYLSESTYNEYTGEGGEEPEEPEE